MKVLNIGRSENADIVINNPAVSRRHAMLRLHWNGKMEIVDLSSNGTSVNNNPIKSNTPYPVRKGDVIVFANAVKLDWKTIKNPYLKYWIGVLGIVVLAAIITIILVVSSHRPTPKYGGESEYTQTPGTKDTTTSVLPHTTNNYPEEKSKADTTSSPIDHYIQTPDQNHTSGRHRGAKQQTPPPPSPAPTNESETKQPDDGVQTILF